MTDSGFSSAASQRSTSSIIRSTHINSFSSSLKTDMYNLPTTNEENQDFGENASIPKPSMSYPSNFGRPVIPNRLIYGKNHGGYSPGLSPFSNPDMSPMSSLTYDFKELNTSHNQSATPRKRLSLSSVSSLDSPHPNGSSFFGCNNLSHVSPAPSSLASSYNSPHQLALADDGCFPDTPTPVAQDNEPLRDGKHVRSLSQEHPIEDKNSGFRRFKSMPASKGRFRLLGVKEVSGNNELEKENEAPSSRRISRHRTAVPNPMLASPSFSPIGTGKTFTRPRQGVYNMMSSPLVSAFSHGKSSAFKPVSPLDVKPQTKRRVLGTIDDNIPVASLSPKQPMKIGGIKRLLDDSTSSSVITVARKRKCSKSLNAKKAFLQERKTKSADAIMTGRPLPMFAIEASPVSSRSFLCRPISAPLLMGDNDEDFVLSHSSLCSHDSDDEDMRKGNQSGDDFASVSSCKEDDIENMLCENIMQEKGSDFRIGDDLDQSTSTTPTCLAGLISGPLLLNNSDTSFAASDANDSITALGCKKMDPEVLKPRELFRSPSAPPLVPSRRALMKLKRAVRTGGPSCETTPVSIKRPRTFASLSDAADTEPKDIADSCLNRSKSYNELDVMKAVDQGCEDASLVGDFSRACSLPTVTGRKQDLKYITSKTLVDVLKEKHNVGMVEVVDCRYTYEYEGGHVNGAVNVWTEEQLIERYFNCAKPMWATSKQQQAQAGTAKPHILIFHCEFSSERGPKLARFLRSHDRDQNVYPNLYYPEVYVLKDGYKEFYKDMKDHCEPRSYVPMAHEDYANELRKFRIKSKTWAGERSKHGLFNRLKHK
uniref:LOW QUALITY PROTEIN: M-phase inducer phosphatase 3-like n=1 Tax=Styela clava TaxID=7725 RepID=UPI00193AA915|nr:LOW QUALITY PROTEIN: M-phase inducer phosphatase 3-like [Styela clava]